MTQYDKKQTMIVYCLECRNRTNHRIVVKHKRTDSNDDFWLQQVYAILMCSGCNSVTFMKESTFSEDYNPQTGTIESSIRFYPERDEQALTVETFNNVPKKLRRIYREVIDAYNRDMYTLCSGGLRAIVEGICKDRKVLNGPVKNMKNGKIVMRKTLEGKINGLVRQSLLTKTHADTLHKHRFLGNVALHDLETPNRDSLTAAIEIIEHTLQNIYELGHIAKRVQNKT